MSKPHECPVCEGGKKKVEGGCEACGGTHVVWEPEHPEEAGLGSAEDALDLTGS